jgi:glycosyltransferase 2 family protein
MSDFLKNILKYGIIFLIMWYLLYDSFSKIDVEALEGKSRWEFIISYWTSSNKFFIFISLLSAVASHLIRAMRWKLVLAPIGYASVRLSNATWAVLNGYFINLFIPKGGEFSRPLSLKKTENVPTDIGVGTVLGERIIDLFFLALCIGSVLLFQADLIRDFIKHGEDLILHRNNDSSYNAPILYLLFTLIIILSVSFYLIFKFNKSLLSSIIERSKEFGKGIWKGIISIKKLEKKGLFITYSILIWLLYYVMIYTMLIAFPASAHISAIDVLTLFIVSGIAMAMPLPGGAGSYHVMVSYALSQLVFIPIATSIAIVTLLHGLHTVLIIVLGGLSVYFISKNTRYGNQK